LRKLKIDQNRTLKFDHLMTLRADSEPAELEADAYTDAQLATKLQ
jgi:FAD synthase